MPLFGRIWSTDVFDLPSLMSRNFPVYKNPAKPVLPSPIIGSIPCPVADISFSLVSDLFQAFVMFVWILPVPDPACFLTTPLLSRLAFINNKLFFVNKLGNNQLNLGGHIGRLFPVTLSGHKTKVIRRNQISNIFCHGVSTLSKSTFGRPIALTVPEPLGFDSVSLK